MGDFLGTGKTSNANREYLPFEEARDIVWKQKLKNQNDWRVYSKHQKYHQDQM